MNRGRHKKSKEKEFNTQAEILGTIRKELLILLAIYESQSTYNMKNYFAKACISSNDGRNYHIIVAWYINDTYYLNNFIEKVKIALDEATIFNSIYTIKFEFGNNTKIFKYKHA
jgi:hypothetical protein